MATSVRRGTHSIGRSTLIGLAIGGGILAVYLVAGFHFADWSLHTFITHLSPETAPWALAFAGIVIASIALPVVGYLHTGLLAPLALLIIAWFVWFGYVALTGVLSSETVFGLVLYLWTLSPILLALHILLGAGEYHLQGLGDFG